MELEILAAIAILEAEPQSDEINTRIEILRQLIILDSETKEHLINNINS